MDGSREREKRDLWPAVIALVFAGPIAGYWTWQTGSLPRRGRATDQRRRSRRERLIRAADPMNTVVAGEAGA